MYQKQVWHDLPSTDTPINAARLNYIEDGIATADTTADAAYVLPVGGIPKTDLATGIQTSLGLADTALQSAPVTTVAGLTGDISLTKNDIGLNLVDNTADLVKSVASASRLTTARTINGVSFDGSANITVTDPAKEPVITAGTTAQYWRGDKSWQTLNSSVIPGVEVLSRKNAVNGYCGVDSSGHVAVAQLGITGSVVGTSDAQTLTRKRVVPRVLQITGSPSGANINTDLYDAVRITNQVTTLAMSSGMTGTPTDFQNLTIRIWGPGLAGINWGDRFIGGDTVLALPYGGFRPLVTLLSPGYIRPDDYHPVPVEVLVPLSGWGIAPSGYVPFMDLPGTLAGVPGVLRYGGPDGMSFYFIPERTQLPRYYVYVAPNTPFIATAVTERAVQLHFSYDAGIQKWVVFSSEFYGYN